MQTNCRCCQEEDREKKPRGNDWQKKKTKRAYCTCNGGRYYIFSCLALRTTYCCGRKGGKYVVTRTSHRKENRGLENRIYPKYGGGGGNRSGLALPLYPRLLLPREILLEGDIYFLFLYSGGTVHSTWNTGPPDSSYILNGSGREGKFLEMRKFLAENFSILLFLFCSPPGGALGEQRRPLSSSSSSSSSSFPKSKVSPRMQIFKVRNGYWGEWTVGVVVLQQTSFRKEKVIKQYFFKFMTFCTSVHTFSKPWDRIPCCQSNQETKIFSCPTSAKEEQTRIHPNLLFRENDHLPLF